MKPIIEVKNISKKYNINHQRGGYIALRDVLTNIFKNPFSFLKYKTKEIIGLEKKEEFWALQDVNFEIMKGEVVGIIGRNGAGKSTLLKILSQITPPTTGEIKIHGRVGSLLEVGTGFHLELTGRENIFLNGAILGMKKEEIVKKFDEIVKFAGVEKFLDTPVKYYSSGMYVRLAFSVAAHMETDILIVDEVLAVGDMEFQKKCLGKMGEVSKGEGRTILFVSHNMSAIKNLCQKVILLESGRIIDSGKTSSVIQNYIKVSTNKDITTKLALESTHRTGRGQTKFTGIKLKDNNNNEIANGISGQQLDIVLNYESKNSQPLQYPYRIGIAFYDTSGQVLFNCATEVASKNTSDLNPNGEIHCTIPCLPLSQGEYLVTLFIEINGEIEDWIQKALTLNVYNGDFFNTGKISPEGWEGRGVLVAHDWTFK